MEDQWDSSFCHSGDFRFLEETICYNPGLKKKKIALDMWDGVRWEAQEGEDICIHIADRHCSTAEINNIVKHLYCNF